MGRIPEETIQAIRDRVDIVDLVGRYVSLRQTGRTFKGLCPFHNEKTPSFHVHPERQIFHCFGCDTGGNAFTFLMRQENLSFPEAVRLLGRECGVAVPEESGAEAGLAERLRRANEVAQKLYRDTLAGREGAAARRYLTGRGLGPELVERFGLGLAPARWDGVARALRAAGIPDEVGLRAGLLAERARGGVYDRLRGRVTFPIRDVRGGIVGFGGRVLEAAASEGPARGEGAAAGRSDPPPKYLNTPESPIFRKREAFYGYPHALEGIRRCGRVVIVEGYFDWLALQRAGIEEGLATCGTALSAEHARALRRRAREVVLFFDGDEAGRRAMERALGALLPERLRVRAVELPPGDDPDSFLEREGAEALRACVERAPAALDRVIESAAVASGSSPWEKADAVARVAPLLALVPDPVERSEFARRLALRTETRPEDVLAVVERERRASGRGGAEEPPPGPSPLERAGSLGRIAGRLARVLMEHPDQAGRLDPDEVQGLVDAPPWDTILPVLVDACRSGDVDVASLADRMSGAARSALLALAAGDDELAASAEEAVRIVDDTVHHLRERRRAAERRALTRRLSDRTHVDADAARLLAEKQRQLEERRAALGITPPGTAPARSPRP